MAAFGFAADASRAGVCGLRWERNIRMKNRWPLPIYIPFTSSSASSFHC